MLYYQHQVVKSSEIFWSFVNVNYEEWVFKNSFFLYIYVKDTLKAFDNFKNKQQVFW